MNLLSVCIIHICVTSGALSFVEKETLRVKLVCFLKMIVTDNVFFFFSLLKRHYMSKCVTNCLTDCTFYSWVMSARTITVLKFHQVLLIFGAPFEQSRLHSASEISSMENTATHKKLALLFTLTPYLFFKANFNQPSLQWQWNLITD